MSINKVTDLSSLSSITGKEQIPVLKDGKSYATDIDKIFAAASQDVHKYTCPIEKDKWCRVAKIRNNTYASSHLVTLMFGQNSQSNIYNLLVNTGHRTGNILLLGGNRYTSNAYVDVRLLESELDQYTYYVEVRNPYKYEESQSPTIACVVIARCLDNNNAGFTPITTLTIIDDEPDEITKLDEIIADTRATRFINVRADNKVISKQYESSASSSVPPILTQSDALCVNLNADLLDGKHASEFSTFKTGYDENNVWDNANNIGYRNTAVQSDDNNCAYVKVIRPGVTLRKGGAIVSALSNNANSTSFGNNSSSLNYGLASAPYAVSAGFNTVSANYAETSFGEFNKTSQYSSFAKDSLEASRETTLFSVGNGQSDSNRHNAFDVRCDGSVYVSDVDGPGSTHYDKDMFRVQDLIKHYRFYTGVNRLSSLQNIPIDKHLCTASAYNDQTVTLSSTNIAAGYEVHLIIQNTGQSDIEITLPTNCVCATDTIMINAGKYGEISFLSDGVNIYARGA